MIFDKKNFKIWEFKAKDSFFQNIFAKWQKVA